MRRMFFFSKLAKWWMNEWMNEWMNQSEQTDGALCVCEHLVSKESVRSDLGLPGEARSTEEAPQKNRAVGSTWHEMFHQGPEAETRDTTLVTPVGCHETCESFFLMMMTMAMVKVKTIHRHISASLATLRLLHSYIYVCISVSLSLYSCVCVSVCSTSPMARSPRMESGFHQLLLL